MSDEVVQPAETLEEIAAPENDSGETAPESAAGETEPKPEGEQKHKGGFQRRIDKLVREKSMVEQEKEFWRQQALRDKSPEPAKPEPAPKSDAKPDPSQFQSQVEYIEALTDWKLEQRNQAAKVESEKTAAEKREADAVQQFTERMEAYRKSAPDLDEVLADNDAPVSQALAQEIRDHEHGPALLYFLAKNPAEAERLSKLAPVAVAREVARMESRFVPSANAPAETQSAPLSKAPKPPTPVGRATATAGKDPGEMSPGEYREWRRKQFPHLDR